MAFKSFNKWEHTHEGWVNCVHTTMSDECCDAMGLTTISGLQNYTNTVMNCSSTVLSFSSRLT